MKLMKMTSLIIIMMKILLIKTKKNSINQKFMMPIECGFNSMKNKKKPINIKFTSVMMIFIIFDLEISIITPMIMTSKKNTKTNLIMMMVMMMFMLMSMMYEMKIKTINWK